MSGYLLPFDAALLFLPYRTPPRRDIARMQEAIGDGKSLAPLPQGCGSTTDGDIDPASAVNTISDVATPAVEDISEDIHTIKRFWGPNTRHWYPSRVVQYSDPDPMMWPPRILKGLATLAAVARPTLSRIYALGLVQISKHFRHHQQEPGPAEHFQLEDIEFAIDFIANFIPASGFVPTTADQHGNAAVDASAEVDSQDNAGNSLVLKTSNPADCNHGGIGTAAQDYDGKDTASLEINAMDNGQSDTATQVKKIDGHDKHRNAIIRTLIKALMDRRNKNKRQNKKFYARTSLTKHRKTTTNAAAWAKNYYRISKSYKNSKKASVSSRKEAQALISENADLQHEYDNAIQRNEDANRYAENLKKQILGQAEEVQAWNTVNKALEKQREGLEEQNLALRKQNESLIEQNQFLDGEHAEVWKENEMVWQQLHAGRDKYVELLEKHQYLLDEHEELCKEHSDVIKEANNYERFIDKYFEDIDGEDDD